MVDDDDVLRSTTMTTEFKTKRKPSDPSAALTLEQHLAGIENNPHPQYVLKSDLVSTQGGISITHNPETDSRYLIPSAHVTATINANVNALSVRVDNHTQPYTQEQANSQTTDVVTGHIDTEGKNLYAGRTHQHTEYVLAQDVSDAGIYPYTNRILPVQDSGVPTYDYDTYVNQGWFYIRPTTVDKQQHPPVPYSTADVRLTIATIPYNSTYIVLQQALVNNTLYTRTGSWDGVSEQGIFDPFWHTVTDGRYTGYASDSTEQSNTIPIRSTTFIDITDSSSTYTEWILDEHTANQYKDINNIRIQLYLKCINDDNALGYPLNALIADPYCSNKPDNESEYLVNPYVVVYRSEETYEDHGGSTQEGRIHVRLYWPLVWYAKKFNGNDGSKVYPMIDVSEIPPPTYPAITDVKNSSLSGVAVYDIKDNHVDDLSINNTDYGSMTVVGSDATLWMAGTSDGIHISEDGGKTWVKSQYMSEPIDTVYNIRGTETWLAGVHVEDGESRTSNSIYRSTNNGTTWELITTSGILNCHPRMFDATPLGIVAYCQGDAPLLVSTDMGVSWSKANIEDLNTQLSCATNDDIFNYQHVGACQGVGSTEGMTYGVYKVNNDGTVYTNIYSAREVTAITRYTSKTGITRLYVGLAKTGVISGSIYCTTDMDMTDSSAAITAYTGTEFVGFYTSIDGWLYAYGTDGKLYRVDESGTSFNEYKTITSLQASAGCMSGNLFLSGDTNTDTPSLQQVKYVQYAATVDPMEYIKRQLPYWNIVVDIGR